MNKLEITDLSFCEAANNSQVQGGLLFKPTFGLDLFRFLTVYMPTLEKYSSEENQQGVVEKFKEPSGSGSAYTLTSKDGKTQFAVATQSKDNASFTTLIASSIF